MSLASTAGVARQNSDAFHEFYFKALLVALAGYAFLGKGFAYAGIPPIFPAEILLLLGLVTLVRPTVSPAVLFNVPHLLLFVMVTWTLVRTFPFVGEYGIDALRDSVIVVYGLFAFVVANLLLEQPNRIDRAVQYVGRFFGIFGAIAFMLYLAPKVLGSAIPSWPNSGAPMLLLRGGEVAVHLAGAAVFALVGLRRFPAWWVALLIVGIFVISAQSRGGMLAILVSLALATLLSGRFAPGLYTLLAVVPVFCVLYLTKVEISLPPDYRAIQVGQLVENAGSIVGSSNDDLDGTKLWRIRWWQKITDYTIHGDYFWKGKGFGVNLAINDGFVVGDGDGPPLRSPHSAHMTILARGGVPGLALWIAVNASWLAMMIGSAFRARLRGDVAFSNLFVFVTCYLVAGLVNASFDVALEGPMMGLVYWTLFGAGVGLSMAYRALPREAGAASRP